MRRKSTRNTKKAAEKGNADSANSPKKANKFINKELDCDLQNESIKNAEAIIQEDLQAPICDDNNTDKSVEMENENSNLEKEKQVEDNQGTEESIDKGKSKDFINSNEQSWNTVEPETENDTVQGTAQSPSYDNDDNVQNVNDTQTNTEDKEENESTENKNMEETQSSIQEPSFESEYVQSTEQQNNYEERSTTPEIRPPVRRSISNEETKSLDKNDKKRFTLRRSPPPPPKEKNDNLKILTDSSDIEKESKQGKKISLKRPTTEEKLENNSEVEIQNNDNHESTKEYIDQRRLSSTAEEKSQDSEGFLHKKLKLIRNLSVDSGLLEENRKRKHSWGKSDWLSNLSSSLYKVDVDTIKIVCPTIRFLKEDEVKLENIPRERTKSEGDLIKRKFSMEKSEDEIDKQSSDESSEEPPRKLDNIIAMNRKISIVEDTASKMRPPPSPAKNPKSEILFITNLVRPFTVKQLKELLERTGTIDEDGFWTDKIKSKCYVRYSSVDEAEATRNALHGINWPIGNGKQLIIDYATAEDMEKTRNPVLPIVPVSQEKPLEKENKEPERLDSRYRDKDHEEKRRHTPVRDFDRHKEEEYDRRRDDIRHRRTRSRSHSRERVKRYNRRSYTPEGFGNKRQKKEEPVPQKLMDDLFLKTKATPSIYWQPLSPEEIALKQKQRMVRMEEHKRRIEETRERENRERRMRESRRIPFRRR